MVLEAETIRHRHAGAAHGGLSRAVAVDCPGVGAGDTLQTADPWRYDGADRSSARASRATAAGAHWRTWRTSSAVRRRTSTRKAGGPYWTKRSCRTSRLDRLQIPVRRHRRDRQHQHLAQDQDQGRDAAGVCQSPSDCAIDGRASRRRHLAE